jgi:hypothetical protein
VHSHCMECALFSTEQLICCMSLCHCSQFCSSHVQIQVQKHCTVRRAWNLTVRDANGRPFCAPKYTNMCIKSIAVVITSDMVISFKLPSRFLMFALIPYIISLFLLRFLPTFIGTFYFLLRINLQLH